MANPKTNSQVSTLDDEVAVATAPATVVAGMLNGANHDSALSGKMEIITIYSSRDDGGTDAVPVGINGYAYQIPRDKPFKIPTEVAQILRDAVGVTYVPGPGGTNTERQQPRFAFTSAPA